MRVSPFFLFCTYFIFSVVGLAGACGAVVLIPRVFELWSSDPDNKLGVSLVVLILALSAFAIGVKGVLWSNRSRVEGIEHDEQLIVFAGRSAWSNVSIGLLFVSAGGVLLSVKTIARELDVP